MKLPFLLFIVSAAFDTNASNGEKPSATKNSTEKEPFIHCKNCPHRTPPALMKWLWLQNYPNQSAGFSKASFGFLFMIAL